MKRLLDSRSPPDDALMNAAALFDRRTWNVDVTFDTAEVEEKLKVPQEVFHCPNVADDAPMFVHSARRAMRDIKTVRNRKGRIPPTDCSAWVHSALQWVANCVVCVMLSQAATECMNSSLKYVVGDKGTICS